MLFYARWFKTRAVTKGSVFFGVPAIADNILGFKFPKKLSNMASYKRVRASSNGLKTNDSIQDWRHCFAVACGGWAAYMLFLAFWKLLRLYLQHTDSVSWCTVYGTKIQFLQIYTVSVGNLFYKLAHKKNTYAVW